MLMSVMERRREIGAGGAGRCRSGTSAIFPIEAVTLTAAGALSGAVLGAAAMYLYARFSGLTFSGLRGPAAGDGQYLLVGLFFGLIRDPGGLPATGRGAAR